MPKNKPEQTTSDDSVIIDTDELTQEELLATTLQVAEGSELTIELLKAIILFIKENIPLMQEEEEFMDLEDEDYGEEISPIIIKGLCLFLRGKKEFFDINDNRKAIYSGILALKNVKEMAPPVALLDLLNYFSCNRTPSLTYGILDKAIECLETQEEITEANHSVVYQYIQARQESENTDPINAEVDEMIAEGIYAYLNEKENEFNENEVLKYMTMALRKTSTIATIHEMATLPIPDVFDTTPIIPRPSTKNSSCSTQSHLIQLDPDANGPYDVQLHDGDEMNTDKILSIITTMIARTSFILEQNPRSDALKNNIETMRVILTQMDDLRANIGWVYSGKSKISNRPFLLHLETFKNDADLMESSLTRLAFSVAFAYERARHRGYEETFFNKLSTGMGCIELRTEAALMWAAIELDQLPPISQSSATSTVMTMPADQEVPFEIAPTEEASTTFFEPEPIIEEIIPDAPSEVTLGDDDWQRPGLLLPVIETMIARSKNRPDSTVLKTSLGALHCILTQMDTLRSEYKKGTKLYSRISPVTNERFFIHFDYYSDLPTMESSLMRGLALPVTCAYQRACAKGYEEAFFEQMNPRRPSGTCVENRTEQLLMWTLLELDSLPDLRQSNECSTSTTDCEEDSSEKHIEAPTIPDVIDDIVQTEETRAFPRPRTASWPQSLDSAVEEDIKSTDEQGLRHSI